MAMFVAGLLSVCVVDPIGASTGSTPPAATNAAVAKAIVAGLKQNVLPNSLTPSLTDVAGSNVYALQGTSYLKRNCDPYNYLSEVSDPKPCIYGAAGAKRTIVIFGDSFVGNWLPALDVVGKNLGYRVAAFEFAGCITAFVPPAAGTKLNAYDRACDEWHNRLPASVRALKPVAILAANGTPSWGVGGDPSWIQGIQTAFNEMTKTSPHTIRVLISISPHLAAPAPACLAAYSSSIQKCDGSYVAGKLGVGLFSASLVRDQKAAVAANATLLPTVQWFCVNGRCPVVVGNLLVYVDTDHTTTVYSKYLSKVFQEALAPILQHG